METTTKTTTPPMNDERVLEAVKITTPLRWKAEKGHKMVGFNVEETEWNMKPNRAGWDTVKKMRVIEQVLTQELGFKIIENFRRENCSYFVNPIIVRCE